MTFKKLIPAKFPRRQWSLVGYPASGKSTFAAQMATPLLPIDADHRFDEVASMAQGQVYELSAIPADHTDAQSIVSHLKAGMPGSGIKTVVVDSLTSIISPLVTQAVMSNDAGGQKNLVVSFKPKAMAMRLLQDEITRWGADTLWVYHFREGLDAKAHKIESTSISLVELIRLRRSLNMQLRIVIDGEKRGITVDWARRGRYPLTLWDETGSWFGMPEKIEEAVYGGLSQDEMQQMERAVPSIFHSAGQAIAWGFEQGCFEDAAHARNAYEQLKREKTPTSASAMKELWVEDVQTRVAGRSTPSDEEYDHYQEALAAPVKQ